MDVLDQAMGAVERTLLAWRGGKQAELPAETASKAQLTHQADVLQVGALTPMTPVPRLYSMRGAVQGHLVDFVRDSGINCTRTEGLVRDVVSQLSAYREEDVPLFPEVFVVTKLTDLKLIAPGTQHHRIGTRSYDSQAAEKILKNTAALATDGWAVYTLKMDDTAFEFGLFRASRHSYSTSADESIRGLGAATPILLVRNRGHLTVEVLNSRDDVCTIAMTCEEPSPSPLAGAIATLSEVVASGVDPAVAAGFKVYFSKLLNRLLQHCHGTLIAAIDPPTGRPPEELTGGVWIDPRVDLAGLFSTVASNASADALADLQAAEALLAGMINSDGVVVLGTNGTVLAFRVFLSPTEAEKALLDDRGGGRRRTFGVMQMRVKVGSLQAALLRSQDGLTECKRRTRER